MLPRTFFAGITELSLFFEPKDTGFFYFFGSGENPVFIPVFCQPYEGAIASGGMPWRRGRRQPLPEPPRALEYILK
jgi:hypothetical protein